MPAMKPFPNKVTLLLFTIVLLLTGGAATVRGQSPLDGFDPNANNLVRVVVVQPDGKIIIGGDFTSLAPNGSAVPRNYIARLNTDGTLDSSFNPNADSSVFSIAVQSDGKILIGGVFTTLSPNGGAAVPRNRIARLNADGTLDTAFDPNANGPVLSIAAQSDGKILIGGEFNSLAPNGGAAVPRNSIARLNADGTLDTAFNPNANNSVDSIAAQSDGKILIGGQFTTLTPNNGAITTRNRIARLNADGTLDSTFNPNANGNVSSIAAQSDGKILVGGEFTTLTPNGGATVSRNLFARLSNDTAALQNLAVTPTTVTWTRDGSSPQLARVTFEYSTDNVNYTPLGNGTAAGSNWTLTGLSLSTGQNIYIRARGYYRSGYQNGSESLTESVRNAFLSATLQPLLKIQRSANTNVVLSWATNFTGFTLESNTNLNMNVWSVVSPAPAVSGTNNVVTNAVSDSMRFYRLRQ
ncbi:MAG: delta-60 repeat domain-containing protein, partial [Limisphaerales bacterium]